MLYTIPCVALAAVAGYLIAQTQLSPIGQDVLAFGAGLLFVGIVLTLRAVTFFVTATRAGGGAYVGLAVTHGRFAAMLAGLVIACAVMHILFTRTAIFGHPTLQLIRPALVASTAAMVSSVFLIRWTWHAS